VKKLVAFCLLLVISLPAAAVEAGHVQYLGGTVSSLPSGALGRLDTTSDTLLTFEYAGNKLVIPYAKIDSFEYHEEVARHLGVFAAIAVGLVKKRQQKHFVQISYRDENNSSQAAVFEVSKHMPQTLLAVLRTRSPQAWRPPKLPGCNQMN
jgi:hypothetical protein